MEYPILDAKKEQEFSERFKYPECKVSKLTPEQLETYRSIKDYKKASEYLNSILDSKEVNKDMDTKTATQKIIERNEALRKTESIVLQKNVKIVKPVLLHGKLMNYRLMDKGINVHKPNDRRVIFIGFNEIDDFIAELKEIKELITENKTLFKLNELNV